MSTITTAAVIIGRNEGQRLIKGLASMTTEVDRVVYVDSGSTDGSDAAARAAGADVIALDMTQHFTAARARNAGLAHLRTLEQQPDLVQFMDGDCELQPDWLEAAKAFLDTDPTLAVVFGRRRERFPEASLYNRMCDWEWDRPLGQAKSCGGDALMRMTALAEVGGYDPSLIAGEEPEMCVRLRAKGWKIWRIDHEMTLHDAAMTRMSQFWSRARRAGHAWAEGAVMHGAPPERHCVDNVRRALLWGLCVPVLIILLALLISPWALALALLYPVRAMRMALRDGGTAQAWERAWLLSVGKFAEAAGVVEYHWRRRFGRPRGLIEYK